MKNQKNLGHPLSEHEMKNIKGGYTFPISEFKGRCPLCGEIIYMNTYTYIVKCENCGSITPIEEEKDNNSSSL